MGLILAFLISGAQDEWRLPDRRPFVACTAEELARLRAARESAPVARVIKDADAALARPLVFPPRGGQHNQWYQCDKCQRALVTVDDTHHRCPGCDKVYRGSPYDDVLFARTHSRNLADMRNAAWAFAIAGEKKYADFAASVLLGYAARYADYPYHDNASGSGLTKPGRSGGRLFEQTLNEAYHVAIDIAPAFDLIHDALGEEDRRTIRERLIRPMLENMDRHKMGRSNWQTWHNAGMFRGGVCLEDVAWMRKAVEQGRNGFSFQLRECVSAEGMWWENSWGYHFYTLSALVATAETARRIGVDLWSHPALRKMFALPVAYTMADGSLPRFGDDVNSSVRGAGALMEAAHHATGEPLPLPDEPIWETVLLGRDAAKKGTAPKLESRLFPGAGHAILRSGGLTAAMTFGPYGGYHGHFDKLSFVFFGFGRELGVDPGRAKSQAYRLPIHANWYRATVGHNAVVVDGKSQNAAAGRATLFAANDRFVAARAECDGAYPGVKHARLLLLTPEYLLVFDDLAADADRRFDWVYHNRGRVAETPAIRFEGEVTTHLTLDDQPGTRVVVGDGPGESIADRVPMVTVTRIGKAARFAAVLEPVSKGAPCVRSVEWKDGAITVVRDGGSDVVSAGARFEVIRGGERVLKGE